jgi:carboxypeptidase Q
MMEAMRILQTLGVQPRRTIRIGLWSAEEQGLWGSRMYVENHPDLHDRISAYLNFDNGTGRIRGIYTQMNEGVIPIFEELLARSATWASSPSATPTPAAPTTWPSTAPASPGFQFIQDPIEYSLRTHHSHVDTFERLVLDDLKQAAVVVASTGVPPGHARRDVSQGNGPRPTDSRSFGIGIVNVNVNGIV